MANIGKQKVLRITDKNAPKEPPAFITEDVVEVQRAKLIYYKWISRLMMLLATGSLFFGVCLTLSILKIAPEIRVEPEIFVEFSDSKSLVKREHIDHKMASREKVMINFMKQYVELRNAYIKDEREMNNRWLWGGLVSYLSTYKVYKAFARKINTIHREMGESNASRSVEILSVERTGGEKSNVWKVEFKTYDYTFEETGYGSRRMVVPTIKERYWTASIRAYVDINRRTSYRRLLNPLGFVVISYYQSEIVTD